MSYREIGLIMGRHPSTVRRELGRNSNITRGIGYLPDRANILAKQRRVGYGSKISRNPDLKALIINKMTLDRYSPEMIAGRLKDTQATITISHESIYQYIYSEEGLQLKLYQQLMRKRPKRNKKYGRKPHKDYGIPNRVSISQRPKIKPEEFGHFEGDLTFFAGSGMINLLTMVERKTGFFMADLNGSKHSEQIACKMLANLSKFPRKARKTVTLDNGKEFVLHDTIRKVLGTPTYFCHPGSPWEKPYVETSHALLHRFIPKNTDPKTLTNEGVQHAVNKLNHLPRKRFNFKTPFEMIAKENIFKTGALRA
jgi:IS30 family transposase